MELQDIISALGAANVHWLAVVTVSPACGLLITSIRWGGLLRAQIFYVPTGFLLQSYAVAGFVRQSLPTTIGGDAIRGCDCWRAGTDKSVAISSVATDRLLGLLALVSLGVVVMSFPNELTQRFPLLYSAIVLSAAGFLLTVALNLSPICPFRRIPSKADQGSSPETADKNRESHFRP